MLLYHVRSAIIARPAEKATHSPLSKEQHRAPRNSASFPTFPGTRAQSSAEIPPVLGEGWNPPEMRPTWTTPIEELAQIPFPRT